MQYVICLTIAPEAYAHIVSDESLMPNGNRDGLGPYNIGTSHRNRNPYARLGINYYIIVSYSDILDIFNNIIRPSAACITHVTRGRKWKPITSSDIIILLSVITTYRCQPLSPRVPRVCCCRGVVSSFRRLWETSARIPTT